MPTKISSGDFRERVRLEARKKVSDGFGNEIAGDWEEQFVRSALYIMKPGSESVLAARLQGTQPVTMILRYDDQTRTIGTDWRAVDTRDGTAFAIRASADMDRKRQWWSLVCVAGEVA